MKSIFCLLALFSVAAAVVTGTTGQIQAGTVSYLNLTGSGAAYDAALLNALVGFNAGASNPTQASLQITSTAATTVNVTIQGGADVSASFSSVTVAGGSAAPTFLNFASAFNAGASVTTALSVQITSTAAAVITIVIKFNAAAALIFSGSVTVTTHTAMLIGAPGFSASGSSSSSNTVYGAVATSYNLGVSTTFVVPINTPNVPQQLYIVGIDTATTASSTTNTGASSGGSSGTASNGGKRCDLLKIF